MCASQLVKKKLPNLVIKILMLLREKLTVEL